MARPKPKPANEKLCSMCKEVKPLEAFSPNKSGPLGRASRCKECGSKVSKEIYGRNPEPQKQRSAEWLKARPDYVKEADKRRYQKHPNHTKARTAVFRAIKEGSLSVTPCVVCGSEKVHGHHHSYEKEFWLDVVFLCTKCHGEVHRGLHPHIKYPQSQPPASTTEEG